MNFHMLLAASYKKGGPCRESDMRKVGYIGKTLTGDNSEGAMLE